MQRKPTKRYWSAFNALYGTKGASEQLELPSAEKSNHGQKKAVKQRPKLECPTEQQEQFVFVAWLRKLNIPHHHSPNGGQRNYLEAAKFKRLGTSAGFPDIFIPLARKSHHGLYIELKRASGGRLSEAQLYWRDLLLREGYAWFEAKGAAQAIEIVEDYLRC